MSGDETHSWYADRTGRPTAEQRHVDVVGRPANIGEVYVIVVDNGDRPGSFGQLDVEVWADHADAHRRATSLATQLVTEPDQLTFRSLDPDLATGPDGALVLHIVADDDAGEVRVLRRPVRS